jgi:hypothetical protein
MKELSYSGESMVTTDAIGDAVVEYARALASHDSADVVDIPVIADHTESVASLMLGPGAQLLVRPAHTKNVSLRDAEAIDRLRRRLASLTHSSIRPVTPSAWGALAIDYDFL